MHHCIADVPNSHLNPKFQPKPAFRYNITEVVKGFFTLKSLASSLIRAFPQPALLWLQISLDLILLLWRIILLSMAG